MKTRKFLRALVSLSVLSIAIGATAQNRDRNPQPNREEVEGMMEAYVLSKLQDSLGLTDEQFGSMVVAQKKLSDTRRAYRRDRMQVLRQMRQTLQREQAGESELNPLLSQLDTLKADFLTNEENRYAAIDTILDIRQRARYRILEVELQRRLAQMMRQVRGAGNDRRPQQFP
jgi:Spy/CpxP family protein refolding chaperone